MPLLRFAFFSGGDKSEEEVRTLAKAAVDNGAKTAVVTMGMRGSYLLEKGREHRQEAHAAQVVDALGAGDSFIAAFLAGIMPTAAIWLTLQTRAAPMRPAAAATTALSATPLRRNKA